MTTDSDNAIAVMLPGEKRAVGIVAVIAMLRMFGLFALLPVLSLYAAELADATPLLIGLAVGAYGLTQAGLQIPLGALSDRVGRVPVIVGGLIVFAAGSIVAAVGDTIWSIILGRLLQGAGAISATLTALIADVTRQEVRTRSMAFFGVGIGLSFMVALVVGPVIAARFGVPSLFWFAAGLAVAAGLLLKGLPANIERPEVPQNWNIVPAFRPDLLRLDLYVFLLHAILTASFVALPFLLLNRLEMPVTDHWQMYIGALFVSLLGTVPLIISDERDHHDSRGAFVPGPAHPVFRELRRCAGIRGAGHIFCRLQLPRGGSACALVPAGRRGCAWRLAGCLLQCTVFRRVCRWTDWWSIPCVRPSLGRVFRLCAARRDLAGVVEPV